MSVIFRLARKYRSKKYVRSIGLGGFRVEDDEEEELQEEIKKEVETKVTESISTLNVSSSTASVEGQEVEAFANEATTVASLTLDNIPAAIDINYIAFTQSGNVRKGKLEIIVSDLQEITYVEEFLENVNVNLIENTELIPLLFEFNIAHVISEGETKNKLEISTSFTEQLTINAESKVMYAKGLTVNSVVDSYYYTTATSTGIGLDLL